MLIVAKSNLIATDSTHLSSNTTSVIHEFPVDSFVLVHYHSGKPTTRLHTVWKGPMRVLSGTDSRYLLLDLVPKKKHRYHASGMKHLIFDPAITLMWLVTIIWNFSSKKFLVIEAIFDGSLVSNFTSNG